MVNLQQKIQHQQTLPSVDKFLTYTIGLDDRQLLDLWQDNFHLSNNIPEIKKKSITKKQKFNYRYGYNLFDQNYSR